MSVDVRVAAHVDRDTRRVGRRRGNSDANAILAMNTLYQTLRASLSNGGRRFSRHYLLAIFSTL